MSVFSLVYIFACCAVWFEAILCHHTAPTRYTVYQHHTPLLPAPHGGILWSVRSGGGRAAILTLTLVTDPGGRDAGGVEVAAAVHVALHAAQHQRGGVRRPAQGALALEAGAAAAAALAALVVAAVWGGRERAVGIQVGRRDNQEDGGRRSHMKGTFVAIDFS